MKSGWIFFMFIFLLSGMPLLTAQTYSGSGLQPWTGTNSGSPGDIMNFPVLGDFKILLIQVKYPGDASGILSSSAIQTHANNVKKSLIDNSYGKVNPIVDITPILTMPNDESSYQKAFRLRVDAVRLAEEAGFLNADYDCELIVSKYVWSGARGLGTINMRTTLVSYDRPWVSVHEMGHSFGWRHANFWHVTGGSPISQNGTVVEYGNKFDMMGGSAGPQPHTPNLWHHFNPWYKERAGWLTQNDILTVTQAGIYRIESIELAPGVGKNMALRIRKNRNQDYWIYYSGDEQLGGNGAIVARTYNNNIAPSELLDMTPGSIPNQSNQVFDWQDAELAVGSTFDDFELGIQIKALQRMDQWIDIEVIGTPPVISHLPIINVESPLPGQTVFGTHEYQVTAYDPDIGSSDGAGIAKLQLWLHSNLDGLRTILKNGQTPPQPIAFTELGPTPPYRWSFDTVNDPPSPITATGYFLIVDAISTEGDTNRVWYIHQIDNSAPPAAAPLLALPQDQAKDVSTNPSISWNPVSGANLYRLQVATDMAFSNKTFDQNGISGNSRQMTGLASLTQYFWRVNATNNNGTGMWSEVRTFTTVVDAPSAPSLQAPADNALNIDLNPTLNWNSVPSVNFYRAQVSTVNNFSTVFFDNSSISVTSIVVTGLQSDAQYFWRVSASNSGGMSLWSETRSFRTIGSAPAAPALLSPGNGAMDIPLSPTFSWNASTNADTYDFQLSKAVNFSDTVTDQSEIVDTTLLFSGLEPLTEYFWRVRAANTTDVSDWSEVFRFITEIATSIDLIDDQIPSVYRLSQNYPNPFNPNTVIEFDVLRDGDVQLTVFNFAGQQVAILVRGDVNAGRYRFNFNASHLPSGLYIYQLQAGNFKEARTMLLKK